MAASRDEIKSQYPLPVYNYKVELDSETMAFSEVSGLIVSYESATDKENPGEGSLVGPRVMTIPEQNAPVTITLKKGVVAGSSVATFFGWLNSIQLNVVDKRDISISLCDEKGDPVMVWKLINAFLTKLDAPTFDTESNDVAIESMELMADSITLSEA